MRWLIAGAKGQLGSDLLLALQAADGADGTDDEVLGAGSSDLDITDSLRVSQVVREFKPDVIVNAAAYTAVDSAEQEEQTAYRVNAVGPANLATAASRYGGRLIQVSTDYVFAGDADKPYEVTAEPAPKSAYGRTKRAGEQAVRELLPDASYIVRTAWVYGAVGGNFVKTMVRLSGQHEAVSVVDDQRGSPTWSADLAAGLVELGRSSVAPGTYHATGGGETTWFGFTQAIFAEFGLDPARVLPTTTDAFPRPAPRPAYSVLSATAWTQAGLTPLPHWRAALSRAVSEIGDQLRS